MDAKNVIISQSANPAGIESAQNVEQAVVQLAQIVSGLSGGGVGTESDPIYTADKPNIALKSEVTPKADKTYVDSQDAILQSQIDGIVAFTETDPYYNADKPNIALKTEVTPKADTTYVDSQDAGLQSQITALGTNKADKTYVDTQDAALQAGIASTNTALASKADKTYVDTQDAALQTAINGKLSGSGVAGRVAYYSGTNATTSSANLFYDTTNNRLGVGTSTPAYQIDSAGGGIRALNTSTTNQFVLDPLDAVGPKLKLGTSTDPVAFWEMGAYNSINNFDNKGRTFKIFNNASPNAVWVNGANGYLGLNVTAAPISRFANTSTAQLGTNGIGVDVSSGQTWVATQAWLAILRQSGIGVGAGGLSVQTDGTVNTNIILEAASGVTKTQKWAVLGSGDTVHSGNIQLKTTFANYNQAASFTADTAGDIRTVPVSGNLQIQHNTVGNSVKGAGTWVQPKYALTNSARFSSVFTLGKTLNTAVLINSTAWTDLTWLLCGNAQANAASGVNIRSQFYYDVTNNLLRCLSDSQEGFTFISIIVINGTITGGGTGDIFEVALFRPDDSTIFRTRIDSTPNTATFVNAELGNTNLYVGDGGADNFQLAPVGTPVSTVPYPVYPTGNAGGWRVKIRRAAGNAVLTLNAARQEIRLFN